MTSVFLMMIGVGLIVAILPRRLIEMTGSTDSVGWIASAFAAAYILVQFPIGRLSDRFGFKRFIVGGYLLCALAGLIFYAADRPGLIFLGRIVQGIGEAPVWAMAPALLALKYHRRQGRIMGAYNAALHLGLTLGPGLGIMLTHLSSGPDPFLLYAGLCLAGGLLLGASIDGKQANAAAKVADTPDATGLKSVLKTKKLIPAFFGILLYGGGYGMFITVIPGILFQDMGLGAVGLGLFFTLFYVAISVSQLIAGPIIDRFGRDRFMRIGLIVAAGGIGLFTALPALTALIPLTLAALGLGVFYLASMAFLNDAVPDGLKGTISGAYFLLWGAGMFTGPLMMTGLENVLGSGRGFLLFSAALAGEALLLSLSAGKRSVHGSRCGRTNHLSAE